MNLGTVLEMAAEGYGERCAIVSDDVRLSYVEMRERVIARASLLRERADAAGAGHVAYLGLSGPTFLEHLLAAAWAGLPFAPLNYRTRPGELASLLDPFRPLLLVHDARYEDGARACVAAGDGLLRSDAQAAPASVEMPFDGEQVAILLHTSGTTSRPKAVVLRHRHLCSYIFGVVEFASAGAEETALACVPPYHIAGVMGLLTPLYAGRRIACLPQFDAVAWLRAATEHSATHAFVVPTMLARILDALDGEPSLLPRDLRHIAYGGGPIHRAVVERALARFPGVDFVNAYGLTETSSTVALLGPEDHRVAAASDDPAIRARLGSVGRALPGIDVRILGEDGGELPPGELGTIAIAGAQVSAHGPFVTGDLGFLDADGYLFIGARSDDMIIRGGENISPGEVEEVLARHPDVRAVAVVGVQDEEWGQRVVAFLEARGAAPSPEELTTWARASLAGFKVPEDFVVVEDLPRTDTGKVLRRRLREGYADASRPAA